MWTIKIANGLTEGESDLQLRISRSTPQQHFHLNDTPSPERTLALQKAFDPGHTPGQGRENCIWTAQCNDCDQRRDVSLTTF